MTHPLLVFVAAMLLPGTITWLYDSGQLPWVLLALAAYAGAKLRKSREVTK